MTNRTTTAWALALTLALGGAAQADPGTRSEAKTPTTAADKDVPEAKAARPVTAWGLTWQPDVEAALRVARPEARPRPTTSRLRATRTAERAAPGKPVLWLRVLGALTGDT